MGSRIYTIILITVLIVIPNTAGYWDDNQPQIIAQDSITTWYHDCSNTSEFQQVQNWNSSFVLTNGTMVSDGNMIYFTDVPEVINEYHGPVYIHNFTESFQFAAISKFYVQFYVETRQNEMAEIKVNLVDENFENIYSARLYDRDFSAAKIRWGNYIYPLSDIPFDDEVGLISQDGEMTWVYPNTEFRIDDNYDMNSIIHSWGHLINNTHDLAHEDGMRRVKYLVIEVGEYSMYSAFFGIRSMQIEYKKDDVLEPIPVTTPIPEPIDEYSFLTPGVLYGGHLENMENDTYYSNLSADTWMITIDPDLSLDVVIVVWTVQGLYVSGTGYGNFPTIEFTLEEAQNVTIQVYENDDFSSSGDYAIKIEQVVVTPIETSTSPIQPFALSDFALPMLFGMMLVIIIIVGYKYYGSSNIGPKSRHSSISVRVPEFVIPPEQKQQYPDILTVRLPATCPNCDGAIIEEDIDWTGPLQAKCNYCGHPIRASFEGA
ncbi:MAG: hypothetical protein RTU30_12070 [Candidatus Thorarchaeota archaeon]